MTNQPNSLSISEASALLATRRLSPIELTRMCLAQIERLNPTLNAFISVTAESALAAARDAENDIMRGQFRSPLHGIPIALKDNIDVASLPTTAASRVYLNNVAAEDAEIVRRLRAAGAIIVGKTNLHEFAYGGSGIISHFGAVRNPWNVEHVTGGSSSGSAAAVAASMCLAAIGTDTAGSIRLPAACCGIVGLKPTYGRVSIAGVVPLAWSYDHAGPLARSVRDAALVADAISGYDARDPESRELPPANLAAACDRNPAALRAGVAREFFFAALDADVERLTNDALRLLTTLVRDVRDIALPVDEDRTISTAESFAYHQPLLPAHADQYQPETLRRIKTGAATSAAAYVRKARELAMLRRTAASHFQDVDVVVTPTVAIPPPRIADLQAHPEKLRPAELTMLRNTRPFNVLGTPAISVPCGFTAAGLPVGLQLTAAPGNDASLVTLAHAYEQAAGWSRQQPALAFN